MFCWFFGHKARGSLAPEPGITPASSVLEGNVSTTGPPGKWKAAAESREDTGILGPWNSIRGQRRGLIAQSFCVIKFY